MTYTTSSNLFVIWTHFLAHIATEDPVAHARPQRPRDRPAQLDGQVGDAASGIQHVRRDKSLGRAGLQAAGAAAAAIDDRRSTMDVAAYDLRSIVHGPSSINEASMSDTIVLHGRVIKSGRGEGPALVSTVPIGFLGGVDPDTGIILEPGHPLQGKSVAGKVLVFPTGKGSTVGSYTILRLGRGGHGPPRRALPGAAPEPGRLRRPARRGALPALPRPGGGRPLRTGRSPSLRGTLLVS